MHTNLDVTFVRVALSEYHYKAVNTYNSDVHSYNINNTKTIIIHIIQGSEIQCEIVILEVHQDCIQMNLNVILITVLYS